MAEEKKLQFEMDAETALIVLACIHVGKHLWRSGNEKPDEAEKRIKAIEKRLEAAMPDEWDDLKIKASDESIAQFLALATQCDLLDQIFISGTLSVAMGRELKEALGSLKGFPLALPDDPNEKEVLH